MSYTDSGPGAWHRGMMKMTNTADAIFAESVRVIPCEQKPNFPAVQHDDEAYQTTAQFLSPSQNVYTASQTNGQLGRDTVMVTRNPHFRFAKSALRFSLKRADRIERCDGTRYEITAVRPDIFHIDVDVVELGRASQ